MGAGVEPEAEKKCERSDGRNLVTEWQQAKEAEGASTAYLTTTEDLINVDAENTDYIMGERRRWWRWW